MPRKSSKKSETSTPTSNRKYQIVPHRDAEWGGYCNLNLKEGDSGQFDDWFVENYDHLFQMLSQSLFDGMKFTITYDPSGSCFIATFTGTAYYNLKILVSLSARADSAIAAIGLLLYKHEVILEGNWGEFMDAQKKSRSWG